MSETDAIGPDSDGSRSHGCIALDPFSPSKLTGHLSPTQNSVLSACQAAPGAFHFFPTGGACIRSCQSLGRQGYGHLQQLGTSRNLERVAFRSLKDGLVKGRSNWREWFPAVCLHGRCGIGSVFMSELWFWSRASHDRLRHKNKKGAWEKPKSRFQKEQLRKHHSFRRDGC